MHIFSSHRKSWLAATLVVTALVILPRNNAMAMTLNSDAFKQNGHIPGDQMPKPFPQTEPAWGLRAYLVLMGCAADRQTVSYDDLARRINRGGPNLLARPLDLITRWCQQHSVPAIASLVVEQGTGLPAPGFSAVSKDEIPREQERVWEFDWYGILPPTIEELAET